MPVRLLKKASKERLAFFEAHRWGLRPDHDLSIMIFLVSWALGEALS